MTSLEDYNAVLNGEEDEHGGTSDLPPATPGGPDHHSAHDISGIGIDLPADRPGNISQQGTNENTSGGTPGINRYPIMTAEVDSQSSHGMCRESSPTSDTKASECPATKGNTVPLVTQDILAGTSVANTLGEPELSAPSSISTDSLFLEQLFADLFDPGCEVGSTKWKLSQMERICDKFEQTLLTGVVDPGEESNNRY